MSRLNLSEAVEELQGTRPIYRPGSNEDFCTAFDMGIRALENVENLRGAINRGIANNQQWSMSFMQKVVNDVIKEIENG